MENIKLRQSFAVDKEGRIKSVDEVARGLECNCTCPCCGERVLARQGEVREWHFAHASGTDCDGAAEGALHLAAKQILLDGQGLMMPEAVTQKRATLTDGRTAIGEARRPEYWLDYHTAEAEVSYGSIRPDIVLDLGGEKIFVEIAVTHYIDSEKREVLEEMRIPTIEIDLGSIEKEKWSWGLLQDVVIESSLHKSWIYRQFNNELEREALEAGAVLASAIPKPVDTAITYSKPPRLRFCVGSRMVDVIERPFGVALWTPYDPVMNERIKALVRMLGGRWQPRFKNWLFPLEAKSFLLDELRKMSGREPDMKH